MVTTSSASLSFVSIGCNRIANCATWGKNGLYAYCGNTFVALYSPNGKRVIQTLIGHKARVNAVKWIPNAAEGVDNMHFTPETELVSGGVDSQVIVWKQVSAERWTKASVLSGHKDSVTGVDALVVPQTGETIIVSCSSDNTAKVWIRKAGTEEWSCAQTISFGNKMMEAVSITLLPGPSANSSAVPCIAIGGVDSLVHLFVRRGETFEKLVSLQGHEDWIRALSFCTCDDGSVMLASASQDIKIRLWKLNHVDINNNNDANAAGVQQNLLEQAAASRKATSLSQRGHYFQVSHNQQDLNDTTTWIVFLDALIIGHEEWVYSVCWHPVIRNEQGKPTQPMKLLTASMDRTMMIWAPEPRSGVWVNEVRVGEFGGLSGLFGQLGFYGGSFGPRGDQILAHGYNGSFHLWKKDGSQWQPQVAVSGHFGPVMDLSWEPSKNYFVTVSEDQTTRLFAPWKTKPLTKEDPRITWHEIARPQIHGYDIECLTFVNGATHKIATGADEKVLRVFEAPEMFLETLKNISNVDYDKDEVRPLGASVPALGLSNKPIQHGDEDPLFRSDLGVRNNGLVDEPAETKFEPVVLHQPPFEEHLLQNTLWPETQKLYGHANELICASCNHNGSYIASACKATKPEIAAVRLWDTKLWIEAAALQGHSLTVTQISFSHDDEYMLTVSRDRNFCVFKKSSSTGEPYSLAHQEVHAHERIIWGCDWSPDNKFFVTGARDKVAKLWRVAPKQQQDGSSDDDISVSCVHKLTFDAGVTAVEFAPALLDSNNNVISNTSVFAVGLETGRMSIWSITETETGEVKVEKLLDIDPESCHNDTVRRMRWRRADKDLLNNNNNNNEINHNNCFDLATCSTDFSVRLFSVTIA